MKYLFILLFPLQSFAQLSIGDKINFNVKQPVIIDFWATWCGSCIGAFGTIDSISRENEGKLSFLMVTDEKRSIVELFIKKRPIEHEVITEDTLFNQTFPHEVIPHYVWINNDKVYAITSYREINRSNIERFLSWDKPTMPIKKDFFADRINAFWNDITPQQLRHFSFFKQGFLDGWNSFTRVDQDSGMIKFMNVPIEVMFRSVISLHPRSRNLKVVGKANSIGSYQLKLTSGDLFEIAFEDLNRYSGYYGIIRKHKLIIRKRK